MPAKRVYCTLTVKKKKKKVDGKNLAGLDLRIAAILLPYITLQTATLSILRIASDEL